MSRAEKSAVPIVLAATAALAWLLWLTLAGCAPESEKRPGARTDIRAEVGSLFEDYVEALNRSDSTWVLSTFAPDSQATLAGRGRFFRGREAIARTAVETLFNAGQNTYEIDSLEVIPIERAHALALVVYVVEPSDQDIPAFHTTATYVLRKSGGAWQIVHAHMSSAREL